MGAEAANPTKSAISLIEWMQMGGPACARFTCWAGASDSIRVYVCIYLLEAP